MAGIWFGVLITAFIAAGVLTQLGWQPGPLPEFRRVFGRRRSHRD